ncbi:MAG: N-acetyl-gamma-glutamyl-phosphate reductase [Candidatus Micrarchaeota archaeon]|nr:N-acetyl-gamma-glutamyl-phosphate reductase [Candidatus Micrarchaeota archaeon]
MKKVGIIGASGYTGHELVKLLTKHSGVELAFLNSHSYSGKKVSDLYSDFADEKLQYTDCSVEEINKMDVDLVFLALPAGHAIEISNQLDSGVKIVDLGADFRFKDMQKYKEVYNVETDLENNDAVYGLPELFRNEIKNAKIVANPGCYATACILASLPIVKFAKYIVFDCKSGWSGAGKESRYAKNPAMLKDNLIPYKLTKHRHKYEVEQFIKTPLSFTPHVLETFRGLMSTCHVLLNDKVNPLQLYEDFYKSEPFVSVSQNIPELTHVVGTNQCNIGGFEVDENNQLVIVSVIDNLLKGASGQAVQNMNLMLGFYEKEGLK